VAKLAGLPQPVIARATEILHQLETQHSQQVPASLPLFSYSHTPRDTVAEYDKLAVEIEQINPDILTPKEALELIYRLKSMA
jgi:DNA mismatch repair protein MutS